MSLSKSRNGKIACLPRSIRDQLNRRLDDGESGKQLVHWLNRLPEVRQCLAKKFHGHAIREQNLSEWKTGGFQEWLAHREVLAQSRELAADAGEVKAVAPGQLADHLATILTARYASALSGWHGKVTKEFTTELRVLRSLAQDVASLRREDHRMARVDLERQRLDQTRQKSQAELVELFQQWAKIPLVRDTLCENWLSPVEREARIRLILDLPPLEGYQAGQNETAAEPSDTTETAEPQTTAPPKKSPAATRKSARSQTKESIPQPAENPAPNPFLSAHQTAFDLLNSKKEREEWLKNPTATYAAEQSQTITPDDRESGLYRISAKKNLSLAGSLAAVGARMPKGEYHAASEAISSPEPLAPPMPNHTESDSIKPEILLAVGSPEWINRERRRRFEANLRPVYHPDLTGPRSEEDRPPEALPPVPMRDEPIELPPPPAPPAPRPMTAKEIAFQAEGRAWRIRMGFDPVPEEPPKPAG